MDLDFVGFRCEATVQCGPDDYRQCLAANDDIENALEAKDAEILGLTVPAGGAVTVVSTAYTYEEASDTGVGGYILVVSNAD